jgi:hypothetical protein
LTNPAQQINDPYNRIAADVAPDGNLNILDIIEVQQTVLDPINYQFTNNTSWRFVLDGQPLNFTPNAMDVPTYDQSASFSNIMADIDDVDFTGVKIGDINRTANPANATGGSPLGSRNAHTLEFMVEDRYLEAGQTYQVELRTKDFKEVLGYQFTLTLDEAASFETVQPGVLEGMTAGNFNMASAQLLTHVWDNARSIDYADGEVVFTVELEALRPGLLSEMLNLNSQLTTAVAYGEDRSQWNVELVFSTVSSNPTVAGSAFELSQNRPNPYADITRIDFTLPQAGEVLFQVIDVNGRAVYTQEIQGIAGEQTLELSAAKLPASGVYHYQLVTETGVATKTMTVTH